MNNGITFLANPNFLNKSKRVTSLANGETISQSDYLNESQYYSAVQLFNRNINTFWHCNKKDGTYLSSNMEMKSFSQDPYKAINSYTSVYQGGSNMSDDSYFTTVVADAAVVGSALVDVIEANLDENGNAKGELVKKSLEFVTDLAKGVRL